MWIDAQPVIDDWQHYKATEREGTIALVAGRKYAIRLDYFENGTPPGKIRLWWASASQAKEIVPQSRLFPSDATP